MTAVKKETPPVAIIKDAKEIDRAIQAIEKTGKKLDRDVHAAALSVLCHAHEHGDITLANKLLLALPQSSRKNALLAWLTNYGPFALSETGKTVAYKKLTTPLELASATAEPWYLFAPEPAFVPFDLQAQIEKLVAKANKALADSEHAGENNVPAPLVKRLQQLADGFE